MFVSLRYNDVEPCHYFYHCGQYVQQQQQQCASATDWSSFYHTSTFSQRQHQQSTAAPCFDYCDTVVPTYSWHQLISNTSATTVQSNACWNQQTTSCSRVSPRSAPCTDNLNSIYYNNHHHRRAPRDYHVAETSYSDNTGAQQLVSASDNELVKAAASYRQHQTRANCEHAARSAQSSHVDESYSAQSTSQPVVSNSNSGSPPAPAQRQPRRSKDALVPLIIRAIMSSVDVRLSLAEICRYIEQHSVYYATSDEQTRWHNNVRHTLSHYEFFVKCGRVPTGRGNYWTVHPVCRAAFAADDLRIKRARHAVQMYQKSINVRAAAAAHVHLLSTSSAS